MTISGVRSDHVMPNIAILTVPKDSGLLKRYLHAEIMYVSFNDTAQDPMVRFLTVYDSIGRIVFGKIRAILSFIDAF